jgi:hypothetical protein
MTRAQPQWLAELGARGLLPAGRRCVMISGSRIRGWGNDLSDYDIYVIADRPWQTATTSSYPVALDPAEITADEAVVDGVRWDLKYWLDSQVDQLIDRVGRDAFDADPTGARHLGPAELDLLERITHAIAADGAAWLRDRREAVLSSALRAMLVVRQLQLVDLYTEDAAGQLAADDLHSAVLSARLAFGHAVDALMAHHGEIGQRAKWRARRVRAVAAPDLPFEDYWAIETMRAYDPGEPGDWVREVVTWCQKISMAAGV